MATMMSSVSTQKITTIAIISMLLKLKMFFLESWNLEYISIIEIGNVMCLSTQNPSSSIYMAIVY